MELAEFYFAHPEMFMVPVEHQTDTGISETFAAELVRRELVDPAWISMLSRALVCYRERVEQLFARARDTWFPSRRQNLCVVIDRDATRPYYQAFDRASWTVYASDFDARTSSLEHAVFQLAHVERLGITRSIARTVMPELSWFLLCTPEELDDFAQGCARSVRPDADAFRLIAAALPWIVQLHHPRLAPPPATPPEPLLAIETAQLLVPERLGAPLLELVQGFEAIAQGVLAGHRARQDPKSVAPPPPRAWLTLQCPRVRVVDVQGDVLWDHARPTVTDPIDAALGAATEPALKSLYADLESIGAHSTRVLAALRDPDVLPRTASEVEFDGGVWLDAGARTVVYSLAQPGLDVLCEAAPPYHRLLLVARTIHEWGHLAADAGIVGVAPDRAGLRDDALERLAAVFTTIVDEAPDAPREAALREHGCSDAAALGRALAGTATGRMGDYTANLFAGRFLPRAAMEAYIRCNVRTLAHERATSLLTRLARHSYEVQYLRFSLMEDWRGYFFGSTWFDRNFVDTGLVTRARVEEAFATVASICSCYAIDESALVV